MKRDSLGWQAELRTKVDADFHEYGQLPAAAHKATPSATCVLYGTTRLTAVALFIM